jgi:hypothetical protein
MFADLGQTWLIYACARVSNYTLVLLAALALTALWRDITGGTRHGDRDTYKYKYVCINVWPETYIHTLIECIWNSLRCM